ncbi:MAG: DUF1330 domain-containing protein [Pseudomonadota bacterium]
MPAFLIVDTDISDPAAYEGYKAAARPIAESHGGVYRARGGQLDVIEGDLWRPTRLVIIEFPDRQSAHAFINAPEYQDVQKIRHAASRCTSVLVDGI